MFLIGADNMINARGNEKKASGLAVVQKKKKKGKKY